jgi:3-oxoacyl-(acyl-carrier-protein) synthase
VTTTAVPALVTIAAGAWPEPGDPATAPPIAGFVVSSFTPIVAAAAERCLARAQRGTGEDRGDGLVPYRTAVVIVSSCGDVASARHVADAVDAGARISPLMFFQSVPNAVAGHLAARHGLDGPVVCLSPTGDPLAAGLAEAALLIADEELAAALVIVADQDPDAARAVLVRTGDGGPA